MKRRSWIGALLAVGMLSLASCGKESVANVSSPKESTHVHHYVDGVCPDDGKYEANFLTSLPMSQKLSQTCPEPGSVEELSYETHSYCLEAQEENQGKEIKIEKKLQVYLPYGYDKTKKYDVVYLLHGTGDNQEYWLTKMGATTRNVVDNMIHDKKCKPFLLVCPTYYSPLTPYQTTEDYENDPHADDWPKYFYTELKKDIVPLVESHYSTYAEGKVDEANLVATRDHRAFAGLSRGSMTVANSGFLHCLDYFSYFGNYSGIWADFAAFKSTLNAEENRKYDVKYWYNGTGTADTVGNANVNQETFWKQALEEMGDRFKNGKNTCLIVFKGGSHAYNCWIMDLYNSLLMFFTK